MPPLLNIIIHHIGGRNGGGPFSIPDYFKNEIMTVFYEADPSANNLSTTESNNIIINKCVGGEKKRTKFNITLDPHASSLLNFSDEYKNAYRFNSQYDCILGECISIYRSVDIFTDTLTSIINEYDGVIPKPDLLIIDTQGTEYEIMIGANSLLNENILSVVCEVEFHPIYKTQKLFGDISSYLSNCGFHFIKTTPHPDFSLYRYPIGLRGEGIMISGDSFFLKRLESINNEQDLIEKKIKLYKLAFISLCMNQLEYALECLKKAEIVSPWTPSPPPKYWLFLRKIADIASKNNNYYPSTYKLHVYKESNISITRKSESDYKIIKNLHVNNFKKFTKLIFSKIKSTLLPLAQVLILSYKYFRVYVIKYLSAPSELEATLNLYGFKKLSTVVRKKRAQQILWKTQ